ncbi:MAG: TIR domain-containing protein [Alistipes sp.]|nr:TIR domain-containing protein [Alistipes sp.]
MTKQKRHYDIFISYRRSSYDVANLIATRLQSVGYNVFFDMEKLRSGKFNEQLFDVIDNCTDFVVVLPPNALDRCVNEDDWVRLEVCRAMERKKNIIPVMLNGFVWPKPMPQGMEELEKYQALTASSVEYFDLAMERLQQRYLLSKRHLPIKKIFNISALVICSLLAVIAILFGVFIALSKSVCEQYVSKLTNDACCVHLLAESSVRLAEKWEKFDNAIEYKSSPRRIADLQQQLREDVGLERRQIKENWRSDSVALQIPPYHSFLLSLRGISSEEIAYSPMFASLYLKDYLGMLDIIADAVEDPSVYKRQYATTLFEAFEHEKVGYYSTLLSGITLFPKKCRKAFHQLNKTWIYFPQTIDLDRDEDYYINITTRENDLALSLLRQFGAHLNYDELVTEEQERKNEKVDREIVAKVDSSLNEFYETLKQNRSITEGDDQWVMWAKVRSWGLLVSVVADYKREFDAIGVNYSCKLTPAKAYAEVEARLNQYLKYHPESAEYVASAKHLFKMVSQNRRSYGGVLIFALKDGAEHPFFKIGDIVVKYEGKAVANYQELKSACSGNKEGVVTYLRLENGEFRQYSNKLQMADIVGFLDIIESE